jgi:hypothetical protein
MLAAAVLASWWAQAEPAPAAAGTPPPAPLVATPALVPTTFDNAIGVYAGWGRRLGSEAQAIGPANGVSVGGNYQRRYLLFAGGFELGAAFDFFYDKYQTDVTGSTMVAPGQEQTFVAQRIISQTSFALAQTVAWRHGRLRPNAAGGAGFTIAYFSTPELAFRPGSFDAAQFLIRGSGGLDVTITRDVAISLRAGYTHVFTHPIYMPGTTAYSFLGDFLDVDLGAVLQF